MKIGIVVINWNGLNLLRKYLKSIIDNSDNSTVYVIDNNSSDESVSYIRENFKEVEMIFLNMPELLEVLLINMGIHFVEEGYLIL